MTNSKMKSLKPLLLTPWLTISGSGKHLDVAGLSTANGAKLYTN